jgi:His-Xaa-Ser system radical SAM maturase HxsC
MVDLQNRNNSGNTLYVVNQCNSNCIMCPDTDYRRQLPRTISFEDINRQIVAMNPQNSDVIITGGEPTLLKYDLIDVILACYKQMPDVKVTLLTNGRALADKAYALSFKPLSADRFVVEIPIHGYDADTHDYITQSRGSFEQTVEGIKSMISFGIPVAIRIVVSKLNSNYLHKMCEFLVEEFPQLICINIMGVEMLGSAYKNKESVWIDFSNLKTGLENCVEICFRGGITPRLFNYPLCLIDEKYWIFYKKSITPSKVLFKEDCSNCSLKSRCGGFFNSTIRHTDYLVKPFR